MTTMDRRSAIKAMAGALAAFILPAPRRHIDLSAFCARRLDNRYDMRLPYTVGDWTFATNAAVCVRVRPDSGDRVQREGKIPPFDSLSWNHDRLAGWRPMPELTPLSAVDSLCPQCEGTGYTPEVIGLECDDCGGTGDVWVGNGYEPARPVPCRTCKAMGHTADAPECSRCRGNVIGVFPAIVVLNGVHFDAGLYAKAQQLGCEYLHDNWHSKPSHPMLKFRFDGGLGQMMAIEPFAGERRVKAAQLQESRP